MIDLTMFHQVDHDLGDDVNHLKYLDFAVMLFSWHSFGGGLPLPSSGFITGFLPSPELNKLAVNF